MARIALALLHLFLLTVVLSSAPSDPAAAPLDPVAAPGQWMPPTDEEEALVVESLALLDAGGLRLLAAPVVSFHTELDECLGNLAYWRVEDGIDRVWVCWTHEDPGVQRIVQTQALVHELAHAWVHANTSEADRQAFMEVAGSASWNGASDAWNDRGVEQAADLITWGVLDPGVLFVDFEGSSCTRWADAYEALTGQSAPTTIVGDCP